MPRVETRALKKALNVAKAKVRAVEGPARKDQDAAPIADAIRDYLDRGVLTFSIPAHGGGIGPAPEFAKWAGLETARADARPAPAAALRPRAAATGLPAAGRSRRSHR